MEKYEKSEQWHLPNEKNKKIKLVKLAGANHLPYSKAMEITVMEENDIKFEIPCYQYIYIYIYNIGETDCNIITKYSNEKIKPDDSVYLKPNLTHIFKSTSKLLVLKIGGKISGDSLLQLSTLNEKKLDRLLDDNKPWFN